MRDRRGEEIWAIMVGIEGVNGPERGGMKFEYEAPPVRAAYSSGKAVRSSDVEEVYTIRRK